MDWNAAIDRNREALKRVLAALRAMAGLIAGPCAGQRSTLPRHLHRAVLRLLRPAEAAARRLVIVAARGMDVHPIPVRQCRPEPGRAARPTAPASSPPPCLPLIDPPSRCWNRSLRSSPSSVPRVSFPGIVAPSPIRRPPMPFDLLDATRLAQRLAALGSALDDLPRQAARFARWRARGTQLHAQNKPPRPRRIWPLRPGRAPGQRSARDRRPAGEVHTILENIHGLALWALEPADTS